MKKKIIPISLAVLCVIFAVAVFISKSRIKDTDIYGEQKLDIDISAQSDNDSQNYWNPENHAIAKGNGGYYYMSYKDGVRRIMFFDEASGDSVPLCAKPECTHEDNNCNAYIGGIKYMTPDSYLLETIYYYEEYIYMIKYQAGMGVLVRISSDGSERKEIGELLPNSNASTLKLVFNGDYVYAFDDAGHAGQTTEADEVIKKISLKDGKSETVFTYTGVGASIAKGRSFGGKLYFIVREYSKNADMAQQKIDNKGVYEYDYNSGETRKVIDENICDYFIDSDNQCMYYFVDGEGLYKYSQKEEKSALIYAANDEIITCKMSYDGKYVYMYNTGMGSLTDGLLRVEQKCFVVDGDGKEINVITCDDVVFFGDENYLFASNSFNIKVMSKENIEEESEWIILE